MKNIDEINAKYNELCQAVDAVDWKLREFARLYDPQIDNLYLKTEALHDMLIEIGEQLNKKELQEELQLSKALALEQNNN
jgi:uncharacterized protein YukE